MHSPWVHMTPLGPKAFFIERKNSGLNRASAGPKMFMNFEDQTSRIAFLLSVSTHFQKRIPIYRRYISIPTGSLESQMMTS